MKYCRTCHAENSVGATLCTSCGAPFGGAQKNAQMEEVKRLIEAMPVLSLQAPPEWRYTPVSIVTAQSVTGTGVFADVGSIFTDMLGRQSGSFVDKLRNGEDVCKASLRLQGMRLRAHAILGVDIDYAEVGGARSMLMVCMTGTAVQLESLDVLGSSAAVAMKRCSQLLAEIEG